MLGLTFYLIFALSALTRNVLGISTSYTEVAAGHLAELPCLSIDDDHLFAFWELKDQSGVVGPGNDIDRNKYNYQVSTGTLLIRSVSSKEAGFYKCVARGMSNAASMKIHEVELIVKRNGEYVWEHSFETNLLRILTVVTIIVVGLAGVVYVVTKKRNRSSILDFESSRESTPAEYKAHAAMTPDTLEAGVDNLGVDIDFPRAFSSMQNDQVLR